VASNATNIHKMVALVQIRLGQEQFSQLDIRHEIDIHCHFELFKCQVLERLAQYSSSIIDQNMNWTVILGQLTPQSVYLIRIA